jgi:hypothetical protein
VKTYALPAELIGKVGALLDNLRAIPAGSVTTTARFAFDNSERGLDPDDDKAFQDTLDLALVLESYGELSAEFEALLVNAPQGSAACVYCHTTTSLNDVWYIMAQKKGQALACALCAPAYREFIVRRVEP